MPKPGDAETTPDPFASIADLARMVAERDEEIVRIRQPQRELEFAYFADGRIAVGWSNETEAGGFTVVGWVTQAVAQLRTDAARG